MRSKLRWAILPGLVLVASVVFAACGSDNGGDEEQSQSEVSGALEEFAPVTAAPDDAQQGGDLTVLAAADVGAGYTDPGIAYYQFAYMVTSATQRALLSWQPDDVEQPTPDLAESAPEISSDNQQLTFTLRQGVKFAPPVDREVVCDDVKYAIDRALMPGVGNGYIGAYMGDLSGLKEAEKQAQQDQTVAPDIAGVQCTDDQTLVIKLDRPTATVVAQALSLPISAPVPEEYAKKFDAEQPSTYADNVVATGPYMIENNAQGELTGYQPNKEIRLIRNPNWDPETDWRPAYLDNITIQEGFTDPTSASAKILNGDASVNGDFPPSKQAQQQFAQEAPDQMSIAPSGGNRYIAMKTTEPPFDDINVRKAVIANSDREALRDTRGGELIGPVATHIIPPQIPGFEEAGGLEGDPSLDYLQNPNGDPQLAAEYMKKAGFKSGKCEGPECTVTMVGDDTAPGRDTATVFKGQLEELGFKVNFRPVTHDVMYTRFCNVPKSQPEICPNVGWIKDVNDGQPILDPTFNGNNILPSNNSNWPLLDVKAINDAMAKAQLINDPAERAQAWGDIDTQIMEQAPVVPWVWDNQPNIESADVAGVINLFNANWDLAFTSLK
jgi:peptide/nickel transport system substrate-binding protein